MVDWHSILVKYGVDVSYEDELMIACPFHLDNRASCAINLDKGVWICFAGCGQGSLKTFIQKISNKSWDEINKEVDTFKSYDLDLDLYEDVLNLQEERVNVSPPDILYNVPNDHWIYERGFSKEIISLWECKVNKYQDFIIPVKDMDNIDIGWITRRKAAIPKYLYSKGFRKSQCLFGANHIKEADTLYVVEGSLDCMWLQQNGYPAIGILGAVISRVQIDLISKYNPSEVVLCLDNDEAGFKGIDKAIVDMENRFLVTYLDMPKNYKDVQEIRDVDILHEVMNSKTIF